MMKTRLAAVLAMAAALVAPASARTSNDQTAPDLTIDAATRTAVVEGALKALQEGYVFPEVAAKMNAAIRERLRHGEYDAIALGPVLADRLTLDLQEVSHDLHLRVRYSIDPVPDRPTRGEPSPEEFERFRRFAREHNHGFERVELLEGNVGYVKLRGFLPAADARDTVAAAMGFVANADALIFDLRENGGGDPEMVQLICSYLFDSPVHLNDLYFRPANETRQFWTLPVVQGKRFADKPVYVLTSGRTFSAAEEFTYNLKTQKRATIVGETTGGGANPGGDQRIGEHFTVFVPAGRAINPITKTNWEGTGVEPDLHVAKEIALEAARVDAIAKLRAATPAGDAERAKDLDGALERAKTALEQARASLPPEPALVTSTSGNTTFRFATSLAVRRVALAGSFNDWNPAKTYFAKEGDAWVCRVDLPPGKTTYKLVVDGRWIVDPTNPKAEPDGKGNVNSVVER